MEAVLDDGRIGWWPYWMVAVLDGGRIGWRLYWMMAVLHGGRIASWPTGLDILLVALHMSFFIICIGSLLYVEWQQLAHIEFAWHR